VLKNYHFKVFTDRNLSSGARELMREVNLVYGKTLMNDANFNPDSKTPQYPEADKLCKEVWKNCEDKISKGIAVESTYAQSTHSVLNDKQKIELHGEAKLQELVNEKYRVKIYDLVDTLVKSTQKFVLSESEKLQKATFTRSYEFDRLRILGDMNNALMPLTTGNVSLFGLIEKAEGIINKYRKQLDDVTPGLNKLTSGLGVGGKQIDTALGALTTIKKNAAIPLTIPTINATADKESSDMSTRVKAFTDKQAAEVTSTLPNKAITYLANKPKEKKANLAPTDAAAQVEERVKSNAIAISDDKRNKFKPGG
jgi:hypothetical protein